MRLEYEEVKPSIELMPDFISDAEVSHQGRIYTLEGDSTEECSQFESGLKFLTFLAVGVLFVCLPFLNKGFRASCIESYNEMVEGKEKVVHYVAKNPISSLNTPKNDRFTSNMSFVPISPNINEAKGSKVPPLKSLPSDPKEAIKQVTANCEYDKRGDRIYALAEQYYANNDLKSALEVINGSGSTFVDNDVKGAFIAKVAERYYSNNDFDTALKVINGSGSTFVNNDVKGAFIAKVAGHYYSINDFDTALKVINGSGSTFVNNDVKGAFIAKVAERYYSNNDFDTALKVINGSGSTFVNNDVKGAFIAKVAEHYYSINDFDTALKVINGSGSTFVNNDVKGAFIAKVAERCYSNNDFDTALKVIIGSGSTFVNNDVKQKFLDKLADHYLQLKDWPNLRKVAKNCYGDQRNKYFTILIKHDLAENNPKDAKELMVSLAFSALMNLLNTGKKEGSPGFLSKASDGCNRLVDSKFNELKAQFLNQPQEVAISYLSELANDIKL